MLYVRFIMLFRPVMLKRANEKYKLFIDLYTMSVKVDRSNLLNECVRNV